MPWSCILFSFLLEPVSLRGPKDPLSDGGSALDVQMRCLGTIQVEIQAAGRSSIRRLGYSECAVEAEKGKRESAQSLCSLLSLVLSHDTGPSSTLYQPFLC